jgi:hypothetical protein
VIAVLALLWAAGASLGAPITGGTPSGEEAVVELAHGDVPTCSATVIAPHAVLTAAHCLSGSALPDIVDGNGGHHAALAGFVHPGFDPASLDHDLAVLVADPPLAISPLPYATMLTAAAGDTIEVIGYGWTVIGDMSPPARRTGTSQLTAIDPLQLHSTAAPSQTCEGDSGGPALFGGQIIGVASSGDPMCVQFAQHTRVDVHADFIAATVARTAAGGAEPGDRCWYAANCATGACTPALDDPRLAFCATTCDGGCASGLACSDGLCRHPAPSPGAAGSACASAGDCADELCVAPSGATAAVCSVRCFTDLPGFTCPDGTACSAAADGQDACFATAPDGGCHAAHGDAGLLLVLLGLRRVPRRVPRRV